MVVAHSITQTSWLDVGRIRLPLRLLTNNRLTISNNFKESGISHGVTAIGRIIKTGTGALEHFTVILTPFYP